MSTTSNVMLVQTSASANANKFYELTLAGDTVTARYGRVGTAGQTVTYTGGQATFDRKLHEKERKGYVQVDVATTTAASAKVSLHSAASKGLCAGSSSDPKVASLIDYLVAKNAHDIGAASGGQIKVTNGQVQTPLGLLTQSTITKARGVLAEVQNASESSRVGLMENYLMLVPQDVGRRRGWEENFLASPGDFYHQSQFLDQLEASLDVALAQSRANDADGDETTSDLFRFKISPVADSSVISRIERKYRSTANDRHGYGVNNARVTGVYELTDSKRDVPFDQIVARVGNVKELWHGSRVHNILSILSKGLFIPPLYGSSIQTAGRMFGNGIYFSEQSTKSANYSRGGVWSSGSDNRWFMLLADVAMGNEYWPNRDGSYGYGSTDWDSVYGGRKKDAKGNRFHSVNVKAGTCGVGNRECVVADLDQINLHYLVELTS